MSVFEPTWNSKNRSGMTMRLLEHYSAVLFFTTNRVSSFDDDAFCSRISMFLRYHQRPTRENMAQPIRSCWTCKPRPRAVRRDRLNGREICSTVRIAQTWARSSGEELTNGHVQEMVNMLGEFCQDLTTDPLREP
jgi:hypothetical protein